MAQNSRNRAAPLAFLILAAAIGGGGLLTFMVFLFHGPLGLLGPLAEGGTAQLINVLLCLVFFAQHSIMARHFYHRWFASRFPAAYDGPLYVLLSGVFVLPLVILWQESPVSFYSLEGVPRWCLRGIYFAAMTGVLWTLSTLGILVNFQVRPLVDHVRGTEPRTMPLIRRGPYRSVRHPLYLCSMLMFWSFPDMTLDRLILNGLFTVWVVLAILLEERDLVADFGEDYRRFQREVPMLIPGRPVRAP